MTLLSPRLTTTIKTNHIFLHQNSVYPPDKSSVRVVGGKDAEDGVAPFQISLQWDREHLCGGSIIGDQYILTASHCVLGYVKHLMFILKDTSFQEYYNFCPFHVKQAKRPKS